MAHRCLMVMALAWVSFASPLGPHLALATQRLQRILGVRDRQGGLAVRDPD